MMIRLSGADVVICTAGSPPLNILYLRRCQQHWPAANSVHLSSRGTANGIPSAVKLNWCPPVINSTANGISTFIRHTANGDTPLISVIGLWKSNIHQSNSQWKFFTCHYPMEVGLFIRVMASPSPALIRAHHSSVEHAAEQVFSSRSPATES